MSARSRGVRTGSAVSSWVRHPVVVPLGAALLSVALLGGVGWVAQAEASRTVQNDAQSRVRSNRDAAVRALVRQADEFELTVATWATNGPVIESLTTPTATVLAAVQDQLSKLARSKGAPSAFVTDLHGRIVAFYPSQPEIIGEDFSYRDWFIGVLRTNKPYVSEGYRTATTGHPMVVGVVAPVFQESRRVGVVTVLWRLDSVRQLSQGARADDGVTISVTDQKGQPLTGILSVDDRGQSLATPLSATTRQALAGRRVDTIVDGMLVSAGPVPGLGWTVTAEMQSTSALAPARTFQRSLGISLGVALLLVLAFTVLAWRFARYRAAEQATAQYARSLIEAGLDPLVTISPEGKITDVNEATIKVTGVTREGLIGTNCCDYFTAPEKANEIYQRAFEQGSVTDCPLTMRHQNGTLTEVLYNAAVHRDSSGKVPGLFAAARDVTEQTLAQAELAKQAKELDRLTELERFQRLAIGRELKMIELKREMEYLKQFAPAEGEESRDQY